jgi:hypothetical protein
VTVKSEPEAIMRVMKTYRGADDVFVLDVPET